jgi:hypothetical protein
MYAFIIAKRHQKRILIYGSEDEEEKSGREPNLYKITDVSERLWWQLSITIVFIGYFGFAIIFYTVNKDRTLLPDAMMIGFGVWVLIAFIGWRITRR